MALALRYILIVFITFSALNGWAQPTVSSPDLRCVSVASNGDVQLTWVASNDPSGDFEAYNIYSSNGGPYALIGTESNISATGFADIGASANLSEVYYYVTAVSNGAQENFALDTLSSMLLNVTDPGNGTAILQWNKMSEPLLNSANDVYYIYKEYPLGIWTLIDSTSALFYRDTIDVCDEWINYQVGLTDGLGCESLSSVDGGQFKDMTPPAPPQVGWVGVDSSSGFTEIHWDPSSSEDAAAYIILMESGSAWIIIDTVYGYNDTSYIDSNYLGTGSGNYGVAAFDSCWSGNPLSPNTSAMGTSHETIFASRTIDKCDLSVTLNWSFYTDWNVGVDRYEVWGKVDNGTWSLITTLSNTSNTYTHDNLSNDSEYCYSIKAIKEGGQFGSLSNVVCAEFTLPELPSTRYVSNIEIEDDTEVRVDVMLSNDGFCSKIEFEKSEDNLEFYLEGNEVSPIGMTSFEDSDLDVDEDRNYYRVSYFDSCGNLFEYSDLLRPILLRTQSDDELLINTLTWMPLQGWEGTIEKYEIYRGTEGVVSGAPIATVGGGVLFYQDDVSDLIESGVSGEYCYQVVAYEQFNPEGVDETSMSNVSCTYLEPLVYIPNAMVIGGFNDVWKPVMNLYQFDSYELKIFARKGQMVFSSSDPELGWDGKYKGEYVPFDVYYYEVVFRDSKGGIKVRNGHITVVQ